MQGGGRALEGEGRAVRRLTSRPRTRSQRHARQEAGEHFQRLCRLVLGNHVAGAAHRAVDQATVVDGVPRHLQNGREISGVGLRWE